MTKKKSKRARIEVEAKPELPVVNVGIEVVKAVVSSHSLIYKKFADNEPDEIKCTEQLCPSVMHGQELSTIHESPEIDPAIDALCDAEVAEICGMIRRL